MATGRFDLSNLSFRGRVGDLVFLPQPNGRAIVRRMPSKPVRRTAAQAVASDRVVEVAAAWKALSLSEGEAWNRYAAAEGRRGYNAFVGLGTKRLQFAPGEPLPTLPPTSAFLGDGIVVGVSSSPLGEGRVGVVTTATVHRFDHEDSHVQTQSPLAHDPTPTPPQGEGVLGVTFSSSGPNAAGVLTELLVQPLASLHRKPLVKEYKSRGFVQFTADALEAAVPCEPGPYACAIRFVRAATGQETGIVPIGKVMV